VTRDTGTDDCRSDGDGGNAATTTTTADTSLKFPQILLIMVRIWFDLSKLNTGA
jgi:hypothetical protein